jgi:hypothetical protein
MRILSLDWIYVLDEDFTYQPPDELRFQYPTGYAFQDRLGVRRLVLHPDGRITVLKGYAWDGCTPKFALWDIVIGIPDGMPHPETQKPKAYHASLVHDALYQFLDADLPLTRKTVDLMFLDLLTRHEFAPRRIYYRAVRIFGGLFRRFTRWKRGYRGQRLAL